MAKQQDVTIRHKLDGEAAVAHVRSFTGNAKADPAALAQPLAARNARGYTPTTI